MEYIKLNNGVEMPVLGYGTYKTTDDLCEEAVAEALAAGYRLIDTAEAYGNEAAVGRGIRKSGIDRKEIFITTKVNFKSYDSARDTVLRSMDLLGTDHLDLVLLHWPFANYYAAWRDLEKLYEEGRLRAIGISNFDPDRMIDLIGFNKIVPAVNQVETHLYCQRRNEHVWMEKYKVQHMAYSPLGQGRANGMFDEPAVKVLAEKYGKTPAQILLKRTVQEGVVVIPKSVTPKRIKENIDIFDFVLEGEEIQSLAALDKALPLIGNPESPEKVEAALTW